jgi:hypothetical protein
MPKTPPQKGEQLRYLGRTWPYPGDPTEPFYEPGMVATVTVIHQTGDVTEWWCDAEFPNGHPIRITPRNLHRFERVA